ncbi:hypothetical protein [Rhizobium leguminosarum]|jgi:hypothetical protein|uniref:hypothetical protein n=1 Tax=Rhizobium leguminosarum TaxID=384 RepID=UPI00140F8564|nr:hypothetical protein [Rhizobium leguminosarum]QIO59220.1 hypothetical protein HA463_16545 [Rhizobium leguminosarum bv. trifolii]
MRFFKQARRFEVYFERQERRILDRFYDRLSEGNDHQFWLGRCYLTVHFYRRKLRPAGLKA